MHIALPGLRRCHLIGWLALVAWATAASPATEPAEVAVAAERTLARPGLSAYRGWIKFLRHEAAVAAGRHGAESPEAQEKLERLRRWLGRIEDNPNLLASLTGVQEWAYESPVDGSGQPFKMAIPTDYSPERAAALSVYLHGYGGNHLEHATGMAAREGIFDVAVLGRARGGAYRGLSEADVLHVIDYVQAHWAVDPARIHLSGGSMGGGGTFRLGARYPHRWASGRPVCGYASFVPLENLITLPLYATHSDDDYVVPVLHARGPLARLRALGGRAILDETTGFGHAAWDYREGNARGDAWAQALVRPDSRTVRRIAYTALDGGAVRSWWAEIAEWGPEPRPARFQLVAGSAQHLHAELENVTRLTLRLDEAPFEQAQPLWIAVNGAPPLRLPAPLPARAELARDATGTWHVGAPVDEPFAFRLHTPGGAALLYGGEPLLIVYGTTGDAPANAALLQAAEAASRSPHPAWLDDGGEAGPDGVPHGQNLYGRINYKADVEVTEQDLARCHLVLIGSAAENALVARLAPDLPVQLSADGVRCSDGVSFERAHLALGLVHYNPLAPDRLVFWVASTDPATYAAGSTIPQLMTGTSFHGAVIGLDLLVMDATAPTLVATRSFDSRWRWNDHRETSPLLPESLAMHDSISAALGQAVREAAGADFALITPTGPAGQVAAVIGTTRVSDILPLYFYNPIGVLELSGAELAEVSGRFSDRVDARWVPQPDVASLEPARTYRVALPVETGWVFGAVAQRAPPYRHTELTVAEAVERRLVRLLPAESTAP